MSLLNNEERYVDLLNLSQPQEVLPESNVDLLGFGQFVSAPPFNQFTNDLLGPKVNIILYSTFKIN